MSLLIVAHAKPRPISIAMLQTPHENRCGENQPVLILQSENQACKRCDRLLQSAKANTKKGESLATWLQMRVKLENQNKAAFITANRLR